MNLKQYDNQELLEIRDALLCVIEMRKKNIVTDIIDNYDINRLIGLKYINLCCSANGHFFRKDVRGFLPEMMERMYADRVLYKKKMLDAQQELERIDNELNSRLL